MTKVFTGWGWGGGGEREGEGLLMREAAGTDGDVGMLHRGTETGLLHPRRTRQADVQRRP